MSRQRMHELAYGKKKWNKKKNNNKGWRNE